MRASTRIPLNTVNSIAGAPIIITTPHFWANVWCLHSDPTSSSFIHDIPCLCSASWPHVAREIWMSEAPLSPSTLVAFSQIPTVSSRISYSLSRPLSPTHMSKIPLFPHTLRRFKAFPFPTLQKRPGYNLPQIVPYVSWYRDLWNGVFFPPLAALWQPGSGSLTPSTWSYNLLYSCSFIVILYSFLT
jgi:hypothetical protein